VPDLKAEAIALGRDERLHAILRDICAATGMGFAAVARVTSPVLLLISRSMSVRTRPNEAPLVTILSSMTQL